jgi:hypothetical protein
MGTPIPPEPKTAALAFITDIQDGTYLLDFVHHTWTQTRTSHGRRYSDCALPVLMRVVRMYQPLKDSWKGGSSLDFIFGKCSEPPLRIFSRRVTVLTYRYSTTLSFGDSLLDAGINGLRTLSAPAFTLKLISVWSSARKQSYISQSNEMAQAQTGQHKQICSTDTGFFHVGTFCSRQYSVTYFYGSFGLTRNSRTDDFPAVTLLEAPSAVHPANTTKTVPRSRNVGLVSIWQSILCDYTKRQIRLMDELHGSRWMCSRAISRLDGRRRRKTLP